MVTLVVNDGELDSDPDTVTVIVQDTTPPDVSDLVADPHELWPPNHKLREVALSYDLSDVADPNPQVELSVSCNEPEFEPSDAEIVNDHHLQLRAEREGDSTDGRIYTITLIATDASGNSATYEATVTVPHDQGKKSKAAMVTSAMATQTRMGAQIAFSLNAEAEVTVTVLNVAGRTVRRVATDHSATAGVNSLVWDGRGGSGAKVPDGLYLVRIRARAADGTSSSAVAPLRLNR